MRNLVMIMWANESFDKTYSDGGIRKFVDVYIESRKANIV